MKTQHLKNEPSAGSVDLLEQPARTSSEAITHLVKNGRAVRRPKEYRTDPSADLAQLEEFIGIPFRVGGKALVSPRASVDKARCIELLQQIEDCARRMRIYVERLSTHNTVVRSTDCDTF